MITIVVGAQYGGEGKGKVSAYLADRIGAEIACRCGGPNSSHTVVSRGRSWRLRMMPTAAVIKPDIEVCFGSGTLIHVPTLMKEIQEIEFRGKIRIDRKAGIITEDIIEEQRRDERYTVLGSTMTGTGYASAARCMRLLELAHQNKAVSEYLMDDIADFLSEGHSLGRKIIVEGHQGFGLSNYHGDYPYTSSRDTTAASMLAEIGLGPIQSEMKIALVVKMFPTRNHSGHLDGEMSPKEADDLEIVEFGGGSWGGIKDRRRRVGLLNFDIVKRAVVANSASYIVLTGVDYFLKTFSRASDAPYQLRQTMEALEKATRRPISYLSWGPDTEAMVDLTNEKSDLVALQHLNRTYQPN
jgi:adenylosuccinate synthase